MLYRHFKPGISVEVVTDTTLTHELFAEAYGPMTEEQWWFLCERLAKGLMNRGLVGFGPSLRFESRAGDLEEQCCARILAYEWPLKGGK